MADITVTPASVVKGANAITRRGTAGGTITAGQPVYKDTAGKYQASDANASALTADVVGIALHGASLNQPLEIVEEDDDFTPGATIVNGTVYIASATAGGIAPVADIVATWYPVVLFVGKSTSKAVMKIVKTGVVT